MSPLRQALADYLRIRRALGYKLERAEKLLVQYLEYLDALGVETVTIENAVSWATLPAAGKNGHWWAFRAVGRQRLRQVSARAGRHAPGPARGPAAQPDAPIDPVPVLKGGNRRADGRDQLSTVTAAPGDLPDADRGFWWSPACVSGRRSAWTAKTSTFGTAF
jgi:hypothetical protein